jgi:hypothetical protein
MNFFLFISCFCFSVIFCQNCINSNNQYAYCNFVNGNQSELISNIDVNISHSNFSNFTSQLISYTNKNVNIEHSIFFNFSYDSGPLGYANGDGTVSFTLGLILIFFLLLFL